jgi:hypothetical protein
VNNIIESSIISFIINFLQIQSINSDSQITFSNNQNVNNFIIDCKTFLKNNLPPHKKIKLEEKQKISNISKVKNEQEKHQNNAPSSVNGSKINSSSQKFSKEKKDQINFELFCLPKTNDRFRFANKHLEIQDNYKKNHSNYKSEKMDAIQKNLRDIENQNADIDILGTNLRIK